METQETISAWAEETFGPAGSNLRVAARANEEMAELLRHLSSDPAHPKAPEEAADVVIVLSRLATRLGCKVPPAPSLRRKCRASLYAVHANANLQKVLEFTEACPRHVDTAKCIEGCFDSLSALCERLGTTLQAEIDKKMQVNRARVWKLDGTGHGYHQKPEERYKAALREIVAYKSGSVGGAGFYHLKRIAEAALI